LQRSCVIATVYQLFLFKLMWVVSIITFIVFFKMPKRKYTFTVPLCTNAVIKRIFSITNILRTDEKNRCLTFKPHEYEHYVTTFIKIEIAPFTLLQKLYNLLIYFNTIFQIEYNRCNTNSSIKHIYSYWLYNTTIYIILV
jgi:hypothetical protein